MSTNRISESFDQALIDRSKTMALELIALWKPEFLQIEPSRKGGISRMGAAGEALTKDVKELVSTNPGLVPPYANADGLRIDLSNAEQVGPIIHLLKTLVAELELIQAVSESEALETARDIYAYLRSAAGRAGGETEAAAVEKLAVHYANRRPRKAGTAS
ncbi:MAG: hypothetical protein EOO11_14960 [Chitinophagaceae bacterium]|nr:MAG: hypothetical protein EOO11_14960 [Chitinophagaceae bacterium]